MKESGIRCKVMMNMIVWLIGTTHMTYWMKLDEEGWVVKSENSQHIFWLNKVIFNSLIYSELTYSVDWLFCRFIHRTFIEFLLSKNWELSYFAENLMEIWSSVAKIFEVQWVYRINECTVVILISPRACKYWISTHLLVLKTYFQRVGMRQSLI